MVAIQSSRCLPGFVAAATMFCSVAYAAPFTLDEAIERVARVHPELKIFDSRQQLIQAQMRSADLKPALSVGVEIENFGGNNAYSGVREAEYTLTLAGVLERGLKREARRAVAARRLDSVGVERAARELDVLAEVSRRYLDVLEMKARQPQLQQAVQRQQELANALRERHRAGGVTESVVLAVEAELARLSLESDQAAQQLRSRWQYLAALWGEVAEPKNIPDLPSLPQGLTALAPFEEIVSKIKNIPDIEIFASADRIHEAQLRLLESERRRDINWELGVRRLEGDASMAIVAGISVPLGQALRADIETAAERARRQANRMERDALILELESLLIQVYGALQRDQQRFEVLGLNVLPKLKMAAERGMSALQEGALTYLELSQMQREWLAAERDQLAVQISILKNMIEMQRLTAEPLSTVSNRSGER